MMDRETKLAILNAMSDESLDHALGAVGIQAGGHDEYGEGEDPSSKLTSWQERDVHVPETTRGPIADKSSLFLSGDKRPRDGLGLPQPGEQDEAMLSAGLL